MNVIGLKNARVYDPMQQADGELMTLWMADGQIISEPSQDIQKKALLYDLEGAVM